MIKIKLNDEVKELQQNISVKSLLESIKASENGIAVAVNNLVVAKSNWNTHILKDDDAVLIIQATQGG